MTRDFCVPQSIVVHRKKGLSKRLALTCALPEMLGVDDDSQFTRRRPHDAPVGVSDVVRAANLAGVPVEDGTLSIAGDALGLPAARVSQAPRSPGALHPGARHISCKKEKHSFQSHCPPRKIWNVAQSFNLKSACLWQIVLDNTRTWSFASLRDRCGPAAQNTSESWRPETRR